MKATKRQTETYILTELDDLDQVTVYATNYQTSRGKLVIECYGDCWGHYWGDMGEHTLQQFVIQANNDYLLEKLLKETTQTDFDQINKTAAERGFDMGVTSDTEIAMAASEMDRCFGYDWPLDLPRCNTDEYHYVSRMLDAIKTAFKDEISQRAQLA